MFAELVLGWSEKYFQDQVMELAERLGWLVYHVFDSRRSQAGFPDLVLLHPGTGRVLFRELKTQTGKTRKMQDVWLAGLRLGGLDAKVWRPEDWVSGEIQKTLMEGRTR